MKFRNEYYFLSNMYPCSIKYNGATYRCVESAFQAQKDLTSSYKFIELDGFQAKRLGRNVKLRRDWMDVRVKIMYELLKIKFSNPILLIKLCAVKEDIIEENSWGDTFWGVCNGRGKNILGRLLEKIKEESV